MHQPLLTAYKECMCLVHGEIVHALDLHLRVVYLDYAIAAIGLADMLTDLEIRRFDPAAFLRIEGMPRCGLDLLTVDGQVLHGEVQVGDERRHREVASLARRLVVGQYLVANLDLADGTLTVIRLDKGVAARNTRDCRARTSDSNANSLRDDNCQDEEYRTNSRGC
ncbi:MAG: hypothetical protein ABI947_09485 [Chloroflexota bacterium]